MWLKLALLLLYAVVLFVLSRVLETVAWYESGYLSRQLLDPFSLGVRKLKLLLDQRGVSYAGVVEKSELTTLVEDSGEVTQEEVNSCNDSDNTTSTQPTAFTCGTHFYERVEDNKDSVWVVQVVHPSGISLLKDAEWMDLIRRLTQFDIHVGVFDCSLDNRFCERKSWYSSRLILALPQGHNTAKDHVKLINYSGMRRSQAVFDWISYHLASRVHDIKDDRDLKVNWLDFKPKNETTYNISWPVRIIMLSKMILPPMFLSALSVKFTGRVKFGKVDIRTSHGKKILKSMHRNVRKASYIVVTPEGHMTYGKKRGEVLSHFSFDLFLRTLIPDLNDLFKVGLFIVNSSCLMGLITDTGGVLRRTCNLLWNFVKYNCLFFILWLPIIGLFHIPYVDSVVFYATKMIRVVNCTELAGFVRHDWSFYSSNPVLLGTTLVLYFVVMRYLWFKLSSTEDTSTGTSDWWSFGTDSYIANYLFHPVTSLTRPTHPQDMEEGMELLIERLAVPNLWLQPMISNDYVKDLPMWTYTKHAEITDDEDTKSSVGDDCAQPDAPSDSGYKPSITCEHCIASAGLPRNPTETECAEFVMDSDYKCLCGGVANGNSKEENGEHFNKHCGVAHAPNSSICDTEDVGRTPTGGEMPDGMLPTTECVICLDNYYHGNILCGLPCGHNFHENCIMGWIMRDNHCCPVCRWPAYKSKCKVHLHAE